VGTVEGSLKVFFCGDGEQRFFPARNGTVYDLKNFDFLVDIVRRNMANFFVMVNENFVTFK